MSDDYELTFEETLEKYGSCTIYHWNPQALATELYWSISKSVTRCFRNLFSWNSNSYNLHPKSDPAIPQVRTVLKKLNWIRSSNLELNTQRKKI